MSFMYRFKRKKPLKRVSDSPNKKAKKKAWDMFSKYIRTRDCLLTTGTIYEGVCITCGKRFPFKRLQAGHFVPGRRNSVLFCDVGTNAQCYWCNCVMGGRELEYRKKMVERMGNDRVEQYEILAKVPKHMSETDFNNVYTFYKAELEKLTEGK